MRIYDSNHELIGKMSRGIDTRRRTSCDLIIERVHVFPDVDLVFAVGGRVIEGGRLLRRKAAHLLKDGFDLFEFNAPEYVPQTVAARLRALAPGESVEAFEENIQVWRNAASRLKFDENRTFKIMRIDRRGVRATCTDSIDI